MKKLKNLLTILIIVSAMSNIGNVKANSELDAALKKIAPDSENAIVKAKAPETFEDMYDMINIMFTKMVDDDKYITYGDCEAPNFTTCNVQISLANDETVFKQYTIHVTYEEPTINKEKILPYLATIEKSLIDENGNEDLSAYYTLSDLSLINFYVSSGKTELVQSGAANKAIKYVNELRELVDNSDFSYGIVPMYGGNFEDAMYEYTGGPLGLFYNDSLYGFTTGGVYLKKVIYIPENTDESKEAYIQAAQKRIRDYLKDDSVTVTYGDSLTNLLNYADMSNYYFPPTVDEMLDPTVTAEDFYFINIGTHKYKFYIIKGSADKLVEPSYKGKDINTKIEIVSTDSSIPLDTGVIASEVEDVTIKNKIDTDNYVTYDINLYSDGKDAKIEKLTTGKFLVSIPVPSKLNGKSLIVYYLTSEGKLEKHEVTIKNGYAMFETDHFSKYTLAEKIEKTKEEKEETIEEIKEEDLTIKVEAASDEDVSAKKEVVTLIEKIISDEETKGMSEELKTAIKQAINTGKTITVDLKTNFVEEKDVKEDAAKVQKVIDAKGNVVGYYDVTIAVSIDGTYAGNITVLDNKVAITLAIPEDVEKVKDGYTRTYTVVRVHDGKAEKLKTTENNDNTLTFESDGFSTYAITYVDTVKTSSPNTGDNIIAFVALLIIAAIGLGLTIIYKKKSNN